MNLLENISFINVKVLVFGKFDPQNVIASHELKDAIENQRKS